MNSNVRKLFSLNTKASSFTGLDEKGKILVDSGFNLVKQYALGKAKSKNKTDFISILEGTTKVGNYSEENKLFVEKLVKYSMEKAGMDVSDFDLSVVANPMVNGRLAFRENFNVVVAQILSPIVPAMISAEFMDLADVSNTAYGDTARFIIHSNDTFYVNRIAEGVKQGSVQRLYNDEVTVNPVPYNVTVAVDWYQVAAGIFDFGEWVYRVGLAFNNYISLMVVNSITEYIKAGVAASPASPYFTNGYTDAKFAKIAETVRAANGGTHVTCYGTLPALAAVLPEAARANMLADLGQEWAHIGHLTTYLDVDLVRINQIMLPNTVNTTALLGIPNDTIYFFADGGYRPVKIVVEGQAITIDIIPTDAPDKEMGLNVTMRLGQTFVAASKFGAITGMALA